MDSSGILQNQGFRFTIPRNEETEPNLFCVIRVLAGASVKLSKLASFCMRVPQKKCRSLGQSFLFDCIERKKKWTFGDLFDQEVLRQKI
jgi:hypothetical protein